MEPGTATFAGGTLVRFWRMADSRWWKDFDTVLAAAVPAGSRILDVGCGGGGLVDRLTELGFDMMGVDPAAPSHQRLGVRSRSGLPERQREAVQAARADAPTRWHSLPILLAACRAAGSSLANEWPTNDQWHDRRTWRSCHLPGTSLSGWRDLNRRPLRPEAKFIGRQAGPTCGLSCCDCSMVVRGSPCKDVAIVTQLVTQAAYRCLVAVDSVVGWLSYRSCAEFSWGRSQQSCCWQLVPAPPMHWESAALGSAAVVRRHAGANVRVLLSSAG